MSQEHLGLMAAILSEKGVTHAVVSPGSRNAPAIIALSQSKKIKLLSIADERSAGFYALGMAQQLRRPVALLCTSGSAALNYAPAVVEAYYQKVPLLVITADRPEEWIDQGDGQTIRQRDIYANYIRKSFHLPHAVAAPENLWQFSRQLNEAIDRTLFPAPGPVHVNLPLREPLYDIRPFDLSKMPRTIRLLPVETLIPQEELLRLADLWNKAGSKLILAGQMTPGHKLETLLSRFADDPSVAILTETTTNLNLPGCIRCIDRTIEGISDKLIAGFTPDILLTFGGAVVSKKIKSLLRKMQSTHHWHINPDTEDFHLDTYLSLTLTIPAVPETFFRQLAPHLQTTESNYRALWAERDKAHLERHHTYLASAPFSDFRVFELLFRHIPRTTCLHLGNSTPIRYAQLFDEASEFETWSNRGTSGIDGSVSTAAGAAIISKKPVTIITGDIGFLYDSNALWNTNPPAGLRIILINNGGGNIFRFIPGPDRFEELEPFIETAHSFSAEGIARNFGFSYFSAGDAGSLSRALQPFFGKQENNRPALLEVFTPSKTSAQVLKDYFKFIIS